MVTVIKQTMMRLLAKASSPVCVQKALEFNVSVSHALMGVGSTAALDSVADKLVLENFRKRCDRNKQLVFFDVGANVGQYGELILETMGDRQFEVHSFEPSLKTFQQLSDNVGKHKNFKLNNFGLGKENTTLKLYSDSPTSGCASLTRPGVGRNFSFEQDVRIRKGNDYCVENHISFIDWLKIDVEGHELGVLLGLQTMFANKCVGEVYFEFGFPAIESKTFLREYFDFFTQHGYGLSRVTLGGSLVPLLKYRGSYEQFRGASSYHAKLM